MATGLGLGRAFQKHPFHDILPRTLRYLPYSVFLSSVVTHTKAALYWRLLSSLSFPGSDWLAVRTSADATVQFGVSACNILPASWDSATRDTAAEWNLKVRSSSLESCVDFATGGPRRRRRRIIPNLLKRVKTRRRPKTRRLPSHSALPNLSGVVVSLDWSHWTPMYEATSEFSAFPEGRSRRFAQRPETKVEYNPEKALTSLFQPASGQLSAPSIERGSQVRSKPDPRSKIGQDPD
ncbi:hypothetical protein C8R46DRAFT_1033781 [Mycena filopes]|nr:hypothetical protein C8R46DRAFT_1033781 [Mycena filopes]